MNNFLYSHFIKLIGYSFLSSMKNLLTNDSWIFYIVHLIASNGSSVLSCSSINHLYFKNFLEVLGTFVQ